MIVNQKFVKSDRALGRFIASEPSSVDEIQESLDSYGGKLLEITKSVSPTEIVSFNSYLTDKMDKSKKEFEIEQIRKHLEADYQRNLSDLNPYELMNLSKNRSLAGMKLARVSIEDVVTALWERNQIIEAFNHPLRIRVRQLYERVLADRNGVFEGLPPLNLSKNLRDELENGDLYPFEDFAVTIPSGKRKSRFLALAIGAYTALGRKQIGIPFGSETMYSVIGNPVALAELVQCHAMASIPRNGRFSDPKEQSKLLSETINHLENSAVLQGRSDRDELLRQWKCNLGILVEADPYKACKRIETVLRSVKYESPIAHVRIYMPEGADEMIETARIIQHYFPDINVHVGQVTSIEQAAKLEEIEVDSIGIGVASGWQCSTGARSGIPPQNFNFLWHLREKGYKTPIFAETGIPIFAAPVALAAGLRRLNYTANLLGILSTNYRWFGLEDVNGKLVQPYDGEAGEESKRRESRNYFWDKPAFIEGSDGWISYSGEYAQYPTIPHKLWYLVESLVLTTTYHRHYFHEDLIFDTNITFRKMSNSMKQQIHPRVNI